MVNDHNDEGDASLGVSIEATHNQDRGHLITSMTQGKVVYDRFHIILLQHITSMSDVVHTVHAQRRIQAPGLHKYVARLCSMHDQSYTPSYFPMSTQLFFMSGQQRWCIK